MSADRKTVLWAKQYQELLTGLIDALGGENKITATRRALATQLATLQCELLQLSSRFAGVGQGGSAADLTLYIKLSDSVTSLLQTVGLDKSLQQQPVASGSGAALAQLTAAIDNVIRTREEDEAKGVFRDHDGVLITNPERIALETEIWSLKQKRASIPTAVEPPASPSVKTVPLLPPPQPTVAASDAPRPAPASERFNRGGSSRNPTTGDQRSTTQRYLDWASAGASRTIGDQSNKRGTT